MHIPARVAVARHMTLVPGGGPRGRWMWPPMRARASTAPSLDPHQEVGLRACALSLEQAKVVGLTVHHAHQPAGSELAGQLGAVPETFDPARALSPLATSKSTPSRARTSESLSRNVFVRPRTLSTPRLAVPVLNRGGAEVSWRTVTLTAKAGSVLGICRRHPSLSLRGPYMRLSDNCVHSRIRASPSPNFTSCSIVVKSSRPRGDGM